MHTRRWPALAMAVLAVGALGGCGAGSAYPAASGSPGTATSQAVASGPVLKTAASALGTIIVDGRGMTVYVYDMDTPNSGVSACTGPCLALWPAVLTTESTPQLTGVTGKVATIPGPAGGRQVTLNGHPLYTYVPDTKPGDVAGQGYGGIWWVLSPDGSKDVRITGTQTTPTTSPTGGGYQGGY